jgi:hypothetical protein
MIALSAGMGRMLTAALCCAALGILLSVRFSAFVLAPASLLVIGFTLGYGLFNGWATVSLTLATTANLFILQMGYCLGGIAFLKAPEQQPFWHKQSRL